jgi:hypothetical protein
MIKAKRMRLARHVERVGEKRWAYRTLAGKPERKRPLGRRIHRLEDNIKMDVRGLGWGCMDWIDLAQYRDQWRTIVKTVMKLRFP